MMMGLQAVCFWVMMTYNAVTSEILYKKKRYGYHLGIAIDE